MFEIGNKVRTEHGIGVIVGFDVGGYATEDKRFVVEYPNPPLHFDGRPFDDNELCYFKNEMQAANEKDELKIWDKNTRQTYNKYRYIG